MKFTSWRQTKPSLSLSLLKKNKKSSGFTIVELLIVIVIIGILAALVIVAYNGIQTRARNTSRIASAKAVQKLVNAYVAQEGQYPSTSYACIGTNYTDWDGDGSPDCSVKGAYTGHPNTAMDTELKKVAKIPNVETTDIAATGGASVLRGYLYGPNATIDGTAGRVELQYFQEGTNQDCGLSGQLSYGSGGRVTAGAKNYSANYYGNTLCIVAIDQP